MKHTPNSTPLPPANREERNTSPYCIVREQRCKCAEATANTLRNSESSRYPKEKRADERRKNIKLHKTQPATRECGEGKKREKRNIFSSLPFDISLILFIFFAFYLGTAKPDLNIVVLVLRVIHCALLVISFFGWTAKFTSSVYLLFLIQQLRLLNKKKVGEKPTNHTKVIFSHCLTIQR